MIADREIHDAKASIHAARAELLEKERQVARWLMKARSARLQGDARREALYEEEARACHRDWRQVHERLRLLRETP